MSDELVLNGKNYVSSKKAAEQTGYARDYIGQLSRGGLIDAERVGGLWYVSLDSLESYEKNAEVARSFSPVSSGQKSAESSLSFEGKEYISASRASKSSGYNQDYIGQLARGGKIPSRQIGNRWYVDQDALMTHKAEKDALLAAVQTESVGLPVLSKSLAAAPHTGTEHMLVLPKLTYTHESADLLPKIPSKASPETKPAYPMSNFSEIRPRITAEKYVAASIPKFEEESHDTKTVAALPKPLKRSRKRLSRAVVGVLTIILVLSVGFAGLKGSSTFASLEQGNGLGNLNAAAAVAVGGLGDVIENWVSPLLVYTSDQ